MRSPFLLWEVLVIKQYTYFPKASYKANRAYLNSIYPPDEAKSVLMKTEEKFAAFIDEKPAPGGLNVLRSQYYGGLSIFAFYEVMDGAVPEEVLQEILWSMLLNGKDIRRKVRIPVNLNNRDLQSIAYGVVSAYARFANRRVDSFPLPR